MYIYYIVLNFFIQLELILQQLPMMVYLLVTCLKIQILAKKKVIIFIII
jgi:hypothetical protein